MTVGPHQQILNGPRGRDNVAPSRVLVAVKAMSSPAWNPTQSHACDHSSWEAEAG